MDIKIAILRGINVGGKRKILMSDLKLLFKKSGFEVVATYIQSGNVVFKSDKSNSILASEIQKIIKDNYDFDVSTIVRTSKDLKQIVTDNPFCSEEEDVNKLYLTFLSEQPTKNLLNELKPYDYSPDKFIIKGENIFIFCQRKYHQSKLTNNFFEKKLEVKATTRNWKTVLKLLTLSNS